MIEGSYIYILLFSISKWFEKQFENSVFIKLFLKQTNRENVSKSSIIYKVLNYIVSIKIKVFKMLKLDKIFSESIFKQTILWASLPIIFSVFLPTMVVLAMILAAFISFAIAVLCSGSLNLRYFEINKYIYFYALIYFIAIFTSVSRRGSLLGGLLTVCFMLFYVVIINSVKTKKQLNLIMFFFISAGILVSIYGFYQFLFPHKFTSVWIDKDMFETIGLRVYSTLENPNVLGEYFLLVIPISFAYFLNSKKIINKLFFLGASAIMMVCLILTYSRGCYVGILISIGLFLILLDKRFIFLAVLGIIALPLILPQNIIVRFLSIGNMEDSSTSYRVYIWMGTIAMLKDYWVCGIGPGIDAFNKVYPAYAYNSISAPHSHNLFLQIACDTGIAGIIIFFLIIYKYYKHAFSALVYEKSKENRILNISGICALTGFFIQSLFDYTFYNYRVMLMFWVVLAFGVLFSDLKNMQEG